MPKTPLAVDNDHSVTVDPLPIKYFLAYYGDRPWTDLILRWNGSGTTWKVTRNGFGVIYTGSDRQITFTGDPNTKYEFTLETVVAGTSYTRQILTYTTNLLPPSGLEPVNIGDTAVSLQWAAQSGVESYDVADVTDSYKIVATVKNAKTTISGLKPSTRQSFSVRSVLSKPAPILSRWSAPTTFFTNPPDNITPGEYTFQATSVYVWRAGRPGSTDPTWLPAQSDWYHGDGLEWGDSNGVQTTYFFFGTPNPFNTLMGAVVSKCEIFLDRSSANGDPGPVLSRLGLHNYPGKPDVEPDKPTATVDAGTLARGESAWVAVPTEWADQLIRGAFALGVTWGGVPERYQVARNAPYGVSPRIGDIRITVG